MSLHYKFKSSTDYRTITFDGPSIALSDLREMIMAQNSLAKTPDDTLEITNAQTKEVYSADDSMIPRNASVIVKRIPIKRLAAVTDQKPLSEEEKMLTDFAFLPLAKLNHVADLAGAKASEGDKIKAMMKQSTEDYEPSLYARKAPPSYKCYRCGNLGHFIRDCPTQGDARYNQSNNSRFRNAGIPREYLAFKQKQEEDLIQSLRAAQRGKVQYQPAVASELIDHTKIPAELQCPMCKKLFNDCVITPCCGISYCDECIRNYLVDNDLVCANCKETTSPDNLIVNRAIRKSVTNLRNQKEDLTSVVPANNSPVPSQPTISSVQGVPATAAPGQPAGYPYVPNSSYAPHVRQLHPYQMGQQVIITSSASAVPGQVLLPAAEAKPTAEVATSAVSSSSQPVEAASALPVQMQAGATASPIHIMNDVTASPKKDSSIVNDPDIMIVSAPTSAVPMGVTHPEGKNSPLHPAMGQVNAESANLSPAHHLIEAQAVTGSQSSSQSVLTSTAPATVTTTTVEVAPTAALSNTVMAQAPVGVITSIAHETPSLVPAHVVPGSMGSMQMLHHPGLQHHLLPGSGAPVYVSAGAEALATQAGHTSTAGLLSRQPQLLHHQQQQILLQQQRPQHLMHTQQPVPQPRLLHQPQQALIRGGMAAGLTLPPGHRIIRRIVPVPVGPRLGIPPGQPPIQNSLPNPHLLEQSVPAAHLLDPTARPPPQVEQVHSESSPQQIDLEEAPMPMSKQEFYLWQKTVMNMKKPPTERSRKRSVSPRARGRRSSRSPSRSRSRSYSRERHSRRRHHSFSPDRKDRGRDNSSKHHRESSQESYKESSKSRYREEKRRLKEKGRHMPEHIKREIDEFEFDEELEGNEDLKRLVDRDDYKHKKHSRRAKERSQQYYSSDDEMSPKTISSKVHYSRSLSRTPSLSPSPERIKTSSKHGAKKSKKVKASGERVSSSVTIRSPAKKSRMEKKGSSLSRSWSGSPDRLDGNQEWVDSDSGSDYTEPSPQQKKVVTKSKDKKAVLGEKEKAKKVQVKEKLSNSVQPQIKIATATAKTTKLTTQVDKKTKVKKVGVLKVDEDSTKEKDAANEILQTKPKVIKKKVVKKPVTVSKEPTVQGEGAIKAVKVTKVKKKSETSNEVDTAKVKIVNDPETNDSANKKEEDETKFEVDLEASTKEQSKKEKATEKKVEEKKDVKVKAVKKKVTAKVKDNTEICKNEETTKEDHVDVSSTEAAKRATEPQTQEDIDMEECALSTSPKIFESQISLMAPTEDTVILDPSIILPENSRWEIGDSQKAELSKGVKRPASKSKPNSKDASPKKKLKSDATAKSSQTSVAAKKTKTDLDGKPSSGMSKEDSPAVANLKGEAKPRRSEEERNRRLQELKEKLKQERKKEREKSSVKTESSNQTDSSSNRTNSEPKETKKVPSKSSLKQSVDGGAGNLDSKKEKLKSKNEAAKSNKKDERSSKEKKIIDVTSPAAEKDSKKQALLAKQKAKMQALKKPDQVFYKPGDAKLKTISEMSKKRLKESEAGEKTVESSKKKDRSGRSKSPDSDVLKSKVTSMKEIITTPEKRSRLIKTSVSEEEREFTSGHSSSGDSRRVVKMKDVSSSKSKEREKLLEQKRRRMEKEKEKEKIAQERSLTVERERLELEKDRKERERAERRRRERMAASEDRERLERLERERVESLERERQALRDKEKLERKLQKERILREELMRQQQESDLKKREKLKRERELRMKEKMSANKKLMPLSKTRRRSVDVSSEEEADSPVKKKGDPGYYIQILDSEAERERQSSDEEISSEDEDEDEERKKKKRKEIARQKKEKRKKKQKGSDDESAEESDSEEGDDKKKKKKKKKKKHKHKSKKSKKHKSKKSKKRKAKKEKSDSEDVAEGNDAESGGEGDSDKEDSNVSESESSDEAQGSKTNSKVNSEDEVASKEASVEKSSSKLDASVFEVSKVDEMDASVIECKPNSNDSVNGENEELELDYNEDLEEQLDDELMFADDEQVNMDGTTSPKQLLEEDFEDGEILDEGVSLVPSVADRNVAADLSNVAEIDVNDGSDNKEQLVDDTSTNVKAKEDSSEISALSDWDLDKEVDRVADNIDNMTDTICEESSKNDISMDTSNKLSASNGDVSMNISDRLLDDTSLSVDDR